MGSIGSMKRMRILFSGRVQGVGFRYTTRRIAVSFKVAGFVRNLQGGDVELVAEGSEQELVGLLHAIRSSGPGRHITREHLRWGVATGEYETFRILN